MANRLTTRQVWDEIGQELFAVLGMVTARGEARTVGVVYVVDGRKLYIGSDRDAWKVRHVGANPHVSVTIPIAKRIAFLPWINIPAATITFSGTARVLSPEEASPALLQKLFRGMAEDETRLTDSCLIEVTPEKDFVTYGIGVSLLQMRDPNLAQGRVSVGD